ncbi:MAG TPA: hypothetical protein PLO57_08690 [Candidatus Cloacimonadota bacterium]|jgi:hypothetical protein|nr:hypothetical protein [Candidatus Cloacimonadota bacterium]HOH59539.1 hypothetical protein [Candidatus Cloacimonadota bacterium]HPI26522.1 hypothetical protein [Candidatus Cloacimonadota bacterium]
MPLGKKINLIRDKIPVLYRYNPFARWLLIGLSMLILIYCVYFLLRYAQYQSPLLGKFVPLVVGFVALDSVLRKVTSLNSVLFESDHVRLGFIAKKPIIIPYDKISALNLKRKITYYLEIHYTDDKGKMSQYTTPASFPHILEIIVNIADLASQAVIPETMKNLLEYVKENHAE